MCRGGRPGERGVKLPNPSTFKNRIRSTQNIAGKVSNIVSVSPIHYGRKDKKRLLNCSGEKGEEFSKYHYVGQLESTHVVVIVFPVTFINIVTV